MRRSLLLCGLLTLATACGGPPTDASDGDSAAPRVESGAHTVPGAKKIEGSKKRLPLSGSPRRNEYLQLGVVEAGFDPEAPAAPPNLRYFTVGFRGIGRARGNDFILDFERFVFAQNDSGCISRPERNATWLERPFGQTAVFTTTAPTEGQLAFLVPEDTLRVQVLIASADESGMVLPAGEYFEPAWPKPAHVIEDGSTLRLLVLPPPTRRSALPAPAPGQQHIVLDVVIENLQPTTGIEFMTSQQLTLVDAAGKFFQLSVLTQQLGCRLDDGDVIPPGHARRLMLVFAVPAGMLYRLRYRGFEVDDVFVDLA